jgi:hypothetical protein
VATETITGTNTIGVTLASGGTYGNPVTIAADAYVGGSKAVDAQSDWTIENAGTISGSYSGVNLQNGGTIINDASGTIYGGGYGVNAMFGTSDISGVVDNSGTIAGYVGVYLRNGGSVTNEMGGTIAGAGYFGAYIHGATATLVNDGNISGRVDGVHLNDISSTLVNTGSIGGGADGVYVTGLRATVENSGTISGDNSVLLNAGISNRLIVDAGADFDGNVIANASADNTLELTAGASPDTITGFGTHYQGFQTVTIDSGASWTVAGTLAGFNGTTIQGFDSDDRLDLTNLAFDAGDTVDIDDVTDVLTVKDSHGTVLDTIQLSGDFNGDFFHLGTDGNGGSYITEDNAPCYCRGTRIRTAAGDRPVEGLKIGDRIMTTDGEVLPLKWIGRRSYRDWLAVGNPEAQPIRFKADSIADQVPSRDLLVSPEHAMFLDGVLVPARHLVNGTSILQVEGMDEIEYFHLEFDRHVVILAEGAAAESFVDDDSRMLFHNADEYRRLYPNEPREQYTEFCAPRVEAGYVLDALHRRLMVRAARLQPSGAVAPAPGRQGYLDRATRTLVPAGPSPAQVKSR